MFVSPFGELFSESDPFLVSAFVSGEPEAVDSIESFMDSDFFKSWDWVSAFFSGDSLGLGADVFKGVIVDTLFDFSANLLSNPLVSFNPASAAFLSSGFFIFLEIFQQNHT